MKRDVLRWCAHRLLILALCALPASAAFGGATVDLLFTERNNQTITPAGTVAAQAGDTLAAQLVMTIDERIHAFSFALQFDEDLGNELELVEALKWHGVGSFRPPRQDFNHEADSTSTSMGYLWDFDGLGLTTLAQGTYTIGTLVWRVRDTVVSDDYDDIRMGLFRQGVNGWLDMNGDFMNDRVQYNFGRVDHELAVGAIQASPSANEDPGTPITLTAPATGGVDPLEYRWAVKNGGAGNWSLLSDWSTSNQVVFTPNQPLPDWRVVVWVRSNGNTQNAPEVQAAITIDSVPGVEVSLSADPDGAQPVNTPITLTANATGGVAPLEYRWTVKDGAAGTWQLLSDWSTDSEIIFTPGEAHPDWQVVVWVRSATSNLNQPEGEASVVVPIGQPLDVTSLSYSPPGFQELGTELTLTTVATGGTAPYQYRYAAKQGVAGSWILLANWNASATLDWTPPAEHPNWRVIVWVRSDGNTANAPEAQEGLTVQVGEPAEITGLSASPSGVVTPGTQVTLTATSTGGAAPHQYRWAVKDGPAGSWSFIQNWSTASQVNFTPTQPDTPHSVVVWVRSDGSLVNAPEGSNGSAAITVQTGGAAAELPPTYATHRFQRVGESRAAPAIGQVLDAHSLTGNDVLAYDAAAGRVTCNAGGVGALRARYRSTGGNENEIQTWLLACIDETGSCSDRPSIRASLGDDDGDANWLASGAGAYYGVCKAGERWRLQQPIAAVPPLFLRLGEALLENEPYAIGSSEIDRMRGTQLEGWSGPLGAQWLSTLGASYDAIGLADDGSLDLTAADCADDPACSTHPDLVRPGDAVVLVANLPQTTPADLSADPGALDALTQAHLGLRLGEVGLGSAEVEAVLWRLASLLAMDDALARTDAAHDLRRAGVRVVYAGDPRGRGKLDCADCAAVESALASAEAAQIDAWHAAGFEVWLSHDLAQPFETASPDPALFDGLLVEFDGAPAEETVGALIHLGGAYAGPVLLAPGRPLASAFGGDACGVEACDPAFDEAYATVEQALVAATLGIGPERLLGLAVYAFDGGHFDLQEPVETYRALEMNRAAETGLNDPLLNLYRAR